MSCGMSKQETEQANKELLLRFYDEVFNNWDFTNIDEMMREDYIQHSPGVEDGRVGFKKFIAEFVKQKPHADIVKILADDDMVCMFFSCTMGINGLVAKVFDLYRVQDGKLAEHWDCVMDTTGVEIKNSNGHF